MNQGNTQTETMRILLVEDNPADVRLTQEALRGGQLDSHIDVVDDGGEAMRFLRGEHPYVDRVLPSLVLLDLNLPIMDGRQVLAAMEEDAALRSIPVVVMTSSSDPRDILRAYAAGANCFVTKPVECGHFFDMVQNIERFWCSIASLPPLAMCGSGAGA